MITKCLAALQSYWPRPQNLVIGGLILGISGLLLLYDYIVPPPTKAVPIAPTIIHFYTPMGLHVLERNHDWTLTTPDEELAQIRSLVFRAADDYVHSISRLKFLKTLSLSGNQISPELGQEIRSLAHLQTLSLGVGELPPGFLTNLGTQLWELEIHAPLLLTQREELPHLTELKFLRVHSSNLTAELAEAIALIPHLETVVVDRQSSYSAAFIRSSQPGSELPPAESAAILKPLRDHPTLRFVYTHWGEYGEPDPAFLKPVWALPMGIRR